MINKTPTEYVETANNLVSYLFEKLQFSSSTRTKNIICTRHRYLLSRRQFFIYAIRTWNEGN